MFRNTRAILTNLSIVLVVFLSFYFDCYVTLSVNFIESLISVIFRCEITFFGHFSENN